MRWLRLKDGTYFLMLSVGFLFYSAAGFVMQHCAGPKQITIFKCSEGWHKETETRGDTQIIRCTRDKRGVYGG